MGQHSLSYEIRQIYLAGSQNTFWQVGQIHLRMLTNILGIFDAPLVPTQRVSGTTFIRQIHFGKLDNLAKCISKLGQIYLEIWTNRFDNLDIPLVPAHSVSVTIFII